MGDGRLKGVGLRPLLSRSWPGGPRRGGRYGEFGLDRRVVLDLAELVVVPGAVDVLCIAVGQPLGCLRVAFIF